MHQPGEIVDLRSDAVSRPTDEMWAAMVSDGLDWSKQVDRTVRDLEERVAGLLGMSDAVFVPTGTMGNTLALLCWTTPGDQFVTEERTHVLISEDQAFARLAGTFPKPITAPTGHPSVSATKTAFEARLLGHRSRTSLLWLENTHNLAGGTVASKNRIRSLVRIAKQHGAAVHLDGARLFNAAVALSVRPDELTMAVDSVTVNLNKGLSALAGALLCGDTAFVEEARARAQGLGGVLSQAGPLAAAGRVAIETMIDRLNEDHAIAVDLSSALAEIDNITVTRPQTNIILARVSLALPAPELVDLLAARGVLVLACDQSTLRLVTHRHIHSEHVEVVARAFRGVVHHSPGRTKVSG
jgi:threonine aldolase